MQAMRADHKQRRSGMRCFLLLLFLMMSARGWTQSLPPMGNERSLLTEFFTGGAATGEMAGAGSVSGVVWDTSEAAIPGAMVTLEGAVEATAVRSGEDGSFHFEGLTPGEYRVHVERDGFEPETGVTHLGGSEHVEVPPIELRMAAVSAVVEVRATGHDVAEAQMQMEEHQRVLGVFPNFYASYAPDAEPLSARQKVHLAWRFVGDPVVFAMAAVVAAGEQSSGTFSGYGSGAAGFGKRFGAAYGDGLTSTLLGQALLPVLLHQDPRYFVKGTGSVASRALYAMASPLICKGDSKRWQVNYSNVLGNLASAGISNAYYPSSNRHGLGLTLSNSLVSTGLGAVGGLIQEFMLRRMTPGVPEYEAR